MTPQNHCPLQGISSVRMGLQALKDATESVSSFWVSSATSSRVVPSSGLASEEPYLLDNFKLIS